MEIRLLKYGCANCYYYDKVCGFGKGKFSALFFRQKDSSQFTQRKFNWEDTTPGLDGDPLSSNWWNNHFNDGIFLDNPNLINYPDYSFNGWQCIY
jgi:hypothetical protein